MSEVRTVQTTPVAADFASSTGSPLLWDALNLKAYMLGNGDVVTQITGTGAPGMVTSVSWTGGIVTVGTPTTTPAFTIAGTSGGIPYFSSGTTWASTGMLTANALVIGGGAGVAPSVLALGTAYQSIRMNAGATANEYSSWPVDKMTIDAADTLTIPAGFSKVMAGPLTVNGTLSISGRLQVT